MSEGHAELVARSAYDAWRDRHRDQPPWHGCRGVERRRWLRSARRFIKYPDLTPERAYSEDVQALKDQGWRWGWELNPQIKTDPRLNPNLPAAQPVMERLKATHAAARVMIAGLARASQVTTRSSAPASSTS